MSYNGKVRVGGPWQTRETSQLEISKLAVGFLDNNVYLLRCLETNATLLIDAAAEPDRILEMCGGSVDAVLTTHCHPDHWQALAEIVERTGAATYASTEDAPLIPVPTDVTVANGDTIPIGILGVKAVKLVGHKRVGSDHLSASIAVTFRDADGSSHAFTGDALFPGGVGNTCDDEAAYAQLLDDVLTRLVDKMPDTTVVYPGHGHDTTIGAERVLLTTAAGEL